jgi:ribonuclease-3
VLGIVVTDHVFVTQPAMPEGAMAKLRAAVVSAATLSEVGVELELGPTLRLGKGEDASGGRAKPSILADAVEAVIGAVYLDGGLDEARRLVLDLFAERIVAEAADGPGGADHKTQLQELTARRFEAVPVYEVRDEGPDHQKRFYAEVCVRGRVVGTGEGRSKKVAEQAAAGMALAELAQMSLVEVSAPGATRTTPLEDEEDDA